MFYLTTHSTHFIYGYMASDIWLRTIMIVRKETRCRHIGYSYRLTARVLLYAPSHRQDNFVTPVVEHWLEREIAQWLSGGASSRDAMGCWIIPSWWTHLAIFFISHLVLTVIFYLFIAQLVTLFYNIFQFLII